MEATMNVSECMSTDVRVCSPDASLRDAARTMKEIDAGFLPVGENDRLVGMVTDRDLAVRGLAEDKGPDARVADVMSRDVCYCFDDDEIEDVSRKMADDQVRRMPVLNRDKRLVGVISIGDISQIGLAGAERSGEALRGIAEPGGQHQQH
jgi:CBS domain-containing protein